MQEVNEASHGRHIIIVSVRDLELAHFELPHELAKALAKAVNGIGKVPSGGFHKTKSLIKIHDRTFSLISHQQQFPLH